MKPASLQSRMELFERACRDLGLSLTVQRRLVFEAVSAREDHPTADYIYDDIRSRLPGISRATVYRILDTLVQAGLIAKICHPGSAARFDPKVHQHHHLVCMHCEGIIDIESPRLDRIPWPNVSELGFEINGYHIHFRGICCECRRRQNSSGRRSGHVDGCVISGARARRRLRGRKQRSAG